MSKVKEFFQKFFSDKKKVIIASTVLVILIGTSLSLYFGGLRVLGVKFFPASATVIVVDNNTKLPVEEALVEIDGKKGNTNNEGKITLSGLLMGDREIVITKFGYAEKKEKVKLLRGLNELPPYYIDKRAEFTTATINVSDYVSEARLDDAVVVYKDKEYTTKKGSVSVENIHDEKFQVLVKKSGYKAQTPELKFTFAGDKLNEFNVALVPEGRVIFLSNRSGQKGIYAADLDGGNAKEVFVPKKGEVQSLSVSPDRKYVVFVSDNEGVVEDGQKVSNIYLGTSTGTVKKIGRYNYGPAILWTPDSKGFLYDSELDGPADSVIRSLNYWAVSTGKITKVTDDATSYSNYLIKSNNEIAYCYSSNDAKQRGLYVFNLNTKQTKSISTKPISTISWKDYGKSAILSSYEDNNTNHYEWNLGSSTVSEVSSGEVYVSDITPSANLSKVVYIKDSDGKKDLYLKENGKERKLTDLGVAQSPILWHNDRYIIFSVKRSGESAKYIVALSGGKAKKVVDESGIDYGPGY